MAKKPLEERHVALTSKKSHTKKSFDPNREEVYFSNPLPVHLFLIIVVAGPACTYLNKFHKVSATSHHHRWWVTLFTEDWTSRRNSLAFLSLHICELEISLFLTHFTMCNLSSLKDNSSSYLSTIESRPTNTLDLRTNILSFFFLSFSPFVFCSLFVVGQSNLKM